jgi:hypothetical protein
MPEPHVPGWLRVFLRVSGAIERLPAWARPAAWGALLLGALTAVRVILFAPGAVQHPARFLTALGALAAASVAGALGGVAYYFFGRPLRRVRVLGPYLAGIVSVFGYLAAIAAVAALVGSPLVGSGTEAAFFAAYGAFIGLVVGHALFRAADRERPARQPANR